MTSMVMGIYKENMRGYMTYICGGQWHIIWSTGWPKGCSADWRKHETLMFSGEDGRTARLNSKWVAKIQAYFTWGSVCVNFGKEQKRERAAMTDFCEYSKCRLQNKMNYYSVFRGDGTGNMFKWSTKILWWNKGNHGWIPMQ